MKKYYLEKENSQLIIKLAKFLRAGAILAIPTETCYGLAVNLHDQETVKRLYKIKQRPTDQPLAIACADLESAKQFAELDRKQISWLNKYLPNSFTAIFKAKANFPLKYNTVGIRFSTNSFINLLAKETNGFALTSANLHGYKDTYSIDEIENQFAGKIFQPDISVDAGTLARIPASTIIDFSAKKPTILRQGVFKLK